MKTAPLIALLFAAGAGHALAQQDYGEADRLARCVNNRARLAQIEQQLAAPLVNSQSEIEATQLYLAGARRLAERPSRGILLALGGRESTPTYMTYFNEGSDMVRIEERLHIRCGAARILNFATTQPNYQDLMDDAVKSTAQCLAGQMPGKITEMTKALNDERDARAELERVAAESRNNIVALRCNEPAAASRPQVAAAPVAAPPAPRAGATGLEPWAGISYSSEGRYRYTLSIRGGEVGFMTEALFEENKTEWSNCRPQGRGYHCDAKGKYADRDKTIDWTGYGDAVPEGDVLKMRTHISTTQAMWHTANRNTDIRIGAEFVAELQRK